MNIEEFIEKLKLETNNKYFIKTQKEYKWYILKLYNIYISESFIVTFRSLRNEQIANKRINIIKLCMETAEKRFDNIYKKYMEDDNETI